MKNSLLLGTTDVLSAEAIFFAFSLPNELMYCQLN